MQSKHVEEAFLLLTRVWSSPGAFTDLPHSISDAAEFYRAQEGSSTKKLFWSQYAGAEHATPLSDQLKQLVELHKAAEVAMKDLIVRIWPGELLPTSYFGVRIWWIPVRDWKSSSDPFALRVPAGPLPMPRCVGARWMRISW